MPDTPFSCFGKKRAKRSRLKEALRTNAPSLRIHPPHRHPAFKNVPIFERFHDTNLQDCSAEPAENRDIFSGRWSNAAGVGSGARMLLARNASPRTTSLVTFLFGYKKVTSASSSLNCNLTFQSSNTSRPLPVWSSGRCIHSILFPVNRHYTHLMVPLTCVFRYRAIAVRKFPMFRAH